MFALPGASEAQRVLDGTIGKRSDGRQIPLSSGVYRLDRADGEVSGRKLLHSFSHRDVWAGERAIFTNDSARPLRNVLARITGGAPSTIEGALDASSIEGANLFLMHPARLIFADGAASSVSVSCTVTTADP